MVMTHSLLTSSLDDPLQGWVFGIGVVKVGRLGEEGILQTNKKEKNPFTSIFYNAILFKLKIYINPFFFS